MERYGDRLICVRYRYDTERRKRLKTVEGADRGRDTVDRGRRGLPCEDCVRRNGPAREDQGRRRAWNHEQKLWLTTGDVVRRLDLHDRVAGWLEPE